MFDKRIKYVNCKSWFSFISNYEKDVPSIIKFKEIAYDDVPNFNGEDVVNILLYDDSVAAIYKRTFNAIERNKNFAFVYDTSNITQFKILNEATEYIKRKGIKIQKVYQKFCIEFEDTDWGNTFRIYDVNLLDLVNKFLILKYMCDNQEIGYREYLTWFRTHVEVEYDY